jgi:CIC family chloride channel protein
MFIGAALGGCVGSALGQVIPGFAASPAHFAYAGMAAMVGGTTGAAVTATIMVFEMTRDYTAILPVILTVTLASAVRQWLSPSTIYTLKLLRRGHVVPQGLQGWMGELRSANVMSPDFQLVSEEEAKDADAVQRALLAGRVVVVRGADLSPRGIIDSVSRLESPAAHVVVGPGHKVHEVLRVMHEAGARVAVVTEVSAATGRPEVLGVITDRALANAAYTMARLAD